MKKFLISIILILFFVTTQAQKEVYFNGINSEDQKVESLKGIELNIGYDLSRIYNPYRHDKETPYYLGYFSEQRIAPTWTLNYSIGISGSHSKIPDYYYNAVYDSISGSNHSSGEIEPYQPYLNIFTLGVKAGIEPRWYWNFKNRAINNTARLNSGWFLSFPLTYYYQFYNSYYPIYQKYFHNYGDIVLKPTLGYRQSISSNIFLEGSIAYGFGMNLSSLRNNLECHISSAYPEIKLKAAYTFK